MTVHRRSDRPGGLDWVDGQALNFSTLTFSAGAWMRPSRMGQFPASLGTHPPIYRRSEKPRGRKLALEVQGHLSLSEAWAGPEWGQDCKPGQGGLGGQGGQKEGGLTPGLRVAEKRPAWSSEGTWHLREVGHAGSPVGLAKAHERDFPKPRGILVAGPGGGTSAEGAVTQRPALPATQSGVGGDGDQQVGRCGGEGPSGWGVQGGEATELSYLLQAAWGRAWVDLAGREK